MTVCACSDPWCRTNGCRIANAQRYGQQINYGPAYVVPNLHAECAKRVEELREEVARLTAEVTELLAREAWLMHAVETGDVLRCDDRNAVVDYLRRKAGKYTLSLKYAALMEAAETIAKAGHPLHAILPHKE
jgi:hypothetical protein